MQWTDKIVAVKKKCSANGSFVCEGMQMADPEMNGEDNRRGLSRTFGWRVVNGKNEAGAPHFLGLAYRGSGPPLTVNHCPWCGADLRPETVFAARGYVGYGEILTTDWIKGAKRLWIEDECTLHDPDAERVEAAWRRIFAEPMPAPSGSQLNEGDSFATPYGNGRVVTHDYTRCDAIWQMAEQPGVEVKKTVDERLDEIKGKILKATPTPLSDDAFRSLFGAACDLLEIAYRRRSS